MGKINCDICGQLVNEQEVVVSYDHPKPGPSILCRECSNESMIELLRLNCSKEDFISTEVSFKDYNDRERFFKIGTRIFLDDFFLLDACEIKDEAEGEGYEFMVEGKFDITDSRQKDELVKKLYNKIQEGISKQYLEIDKCFGKTSYELCCDELVGRFARAKKGRRHPYVVIDGTEYSWSEFGRFLMNQDGADFSMKFNLED